jgi:hypothetical protein
LQSPSVETTTHEIDHIIGFNHPFEYDGCGIMSYDDERGNYD